MTNRSTGNPAVAPAGCPITHTDYRVERPIFGHYAQLNAEREQSDFLLNDSTKDPFYMIQRFDHVLEAMQMPDVFSNDIVNALDPFMEVRFLPNNLNPPEHTRMRKVLNRWSRGLPSGGSKSRYTSAATSCSRSSPPRASATWCRSSRSGSRPTCSS